MNPNFKFLEQAVPNEFKQDKRYKEFVQAQTDYLRLKVVEELWRKKLPVSAANASEIEVLLEERKRIIKKLEAMVPNIQKCSPDQVVKIIEMSMNIQSYDKWSNLTLAQLQDSLERMEKDSRDLPEETFSGLKSLDNSKQPRSYGTGAKGKVARHFSNSASYLSSVDAQSKFLQMQSQRQEQLFNELFDLRAYIRAREKQEEIAKETGTSPKKRNRHEKVTLDPVATKCMLTKLKSRYHTKGEFLNNSVTCNFPIDLAYIAFGAPESARRALMIKGKGGELNCIKDPFAFYYQDLRGTVSGHYFFLSDEKKQNSESLPAILNIGHSKFHGNMNVNAMSEYSRLSAMP